MSSQHNSHTRKSEVKADVRICISLRACSLICLCACLLVCMFVCSDKFQNIHKHFEKISPFDVLTSPKTSTISHEHFECEKVPNNDFVDCS